MDQRVNSDSPRKALDATDRCVNLTRMTDHADSLHQIATNRFSCRKFLPDPVSDGVITDIVSTARHAPSWNNVQPWKLTITTGEATDKFRSALHARAAAGASPEPDLDWPTDYPGALGERRRTCGYQLYEAVGIERHDHAARTAQMLENFSLFDAPHVAIVTSPKVLGAYGALDCGGFLTAFCLAAQARGVGTILQAAIAAQAPFVRDWFDLPEEEIILCAISFGRPDMSHPINTYRTARETPDALITWKS